MIAIRGIYENGQIRLEKPIEDAGPVEVLVVFPDGANDPWTRILEDASPRPRLAEWVKEVEEEIAQGKAVPLDLGQL